MGGMTNLINYVLSNLPIHYLSLFKALSKVIHKLVLIQMKFLWADSKDKKGISWVSWSKVCRPKVEGGLGNKNLGRFNNAQLPKWIWRFVTEKGKLWEGILVSRYGNLASTLWNGELSI
ncbi:unnamed protein product [Lathyrus sativus]|nr:unnamed protein product [Lathyrus sativus]